MVIITLVLDGSTVDVQLNKSGRTRYELAGYEIMEYDVNNYG